VKTCGRENAVGNLRKVELGVEDVVSEEIASAGADVVFASPPPPPCQVFAAISLDCLFLDFARLIWF
jgi:hypothetical protein